MPFWRDAVGAADTATLQRLDRRAASDYGLSAAVLMENAGRAVAEAVLERRPRRVVVFCGGGNNGGDGLVAARWLANAGVEVRVALARSPAHYQSAAAQNWTAARALRLPFLVFEERQKLLEFIDGWDVGVDALLGTGTSGAPREPEATLIQILNASGRPVVAVDVPSGLDADTGTPSPVTVRAAETVTFAFPKKGFAAPAARAVLGRCRVADIGFPRDFDHEARFDSPS